MRHACPPVQMKRYLAEFFLPVSGEPVSRGKMKTAGTIRFFAAAPTIFLLTLYTLITYKKAAYQQRASDIILLIWLVLFFVYIMTNVLISADKRQRTVRLLTYVCIVIEFSTNQLILYATGSLTSHAVIFLVVLVCIYRVFFDYRISLFAAAASGVLYAAVAVFEVRGLLPLTPYLPSPLNHMAYADPRTSVCIILAVVFGILMTFFITNFCMNQVLKLHRYILEDLREEKIKAETDALTGLFNRRAFDEQFPKAVRQAADRSTELSLLIIDIDDFKKYNDTFGHQAGDGLLLAVSKVIADCVRSQDFAARFGGDEFVVILEETDGQAAARSADRIRNAVESLPQDTVKSRVTVSIGLSTLPYDGKDTASLVKHADDYLYSSKKNGKNRISALRPTTLTQKNTDRA